jgi:hypothetical protein
MKYTNNTSKDELKKILEIAILTGDLNKRNDRVIKIIKSKRNFENLSLGKFCL